MERKSLNYLLWLIFGLGLLLRILFLWKGASIYYGGPDAIYFTGDSASYMLPFENLLHYGHYTFDELEPDAAFGRLPGYPFFYGLHYLLVGPKYAPLAVACTQVLLDSCAVLLVFSLVRQLQAHLVGPASRAGWPAHLGALLYATYPFVIVYVTKVGTETLATFLTLACLTWLLRPGYTVKHFVGLALLLALAFYVREYLGILVPISCFYIWVTYRPAVRPAVGRLAALLLVGGIFGALYALWPVRNYVSFHRVMLLKTTTAGYAHYNKDFTSYRRWVLSWTNDEQPWIEGAIASPNLVFPADLFDSPAEAAMAQRGVALANTCGSSFYLWQKMNKPGYNNEKYAAARRSDRFLHNCNDEVAATFQSLEHSYRAHHPMRYWLRVPSQNLFKAFFKSGTRAGDESANSAKVLLMRALFGWRTLLLVLGFASVCYHWRRPQFWVIGLFAGFMYLFICGVMRNLEMRYLVQADAVLLSVVPLLLSSIVYRRQITPASTTV